MTITNEKTRAWQSDQATLLDSTDFINATVRLLNGGLPGTGQPSDGQQISDKINELLFAELKDARGVHAETLLALLGALAGFSVQMAMRETLVKTGKIPENKLFVVFKTPGGENFYLGDALNEGLLEAKPGALSVYAIVGGGAQQAGARELPDIREIARFVASTLGSDRFGIPRLPAANIPRAQPIDLLKKYWNPVRNFMVVNVQAPHHWPFVLALCAQKIIIMAKASLDPAIAAKLVMETAIAMAKVDPARVPYAYVQAY